MALTPEQEAKVLQIITAFDNGKRLNELPHIGEVNPLELIVEVMDTDGESKQAKLATMLPYLEDQCAYGIQWDTTVSTPTCTRIGSIALHKSLPIQNRMRGCLLSDNGTVVEYLNPTNWRAHTLDGSKGQVMVEIPAHYRKFETEGTIRRCKLSEYPLPGYHAVPKMYISAYEAAMERSTGKLCSVVNMGTDYRGGNNQADWDGTYRSVLGRPVTVKSRTAFRNAARLRNASATNEWNCLDYNAYKAVFWLYYVEYANRNCQTAFNAQKDTNGFAQGGLGNGVTNTPDWNGFNGYYPFVPCGYTDELGNASGEVAYVMQNAEGGTHGTVYVPRYRGIEIRSDTFGNGRTASIFKSPRLLTAGHQKYMLLTTPQTTTTATTTATLCEEKKPEPKHTSKNLSSVSSATSCQRWWAAVQQPIGRTTTIPTFLHRVQFFVVSCSAVMRITVRMRASAMRFRLTPPRIRMRTSALAFALYPICK